MTNKTELGRLFASQTMRRLTRAAVHVPGARRSARGIVRNELGRLLGGAVRDGIGVMWAPVNGKSPAPGAGRGREPMDFSGGMSGFGQKSTENMIDEMVATALSRGRRTSGVLGALFNLMPALAGR